MAVSIFNVREDSGSREDFWVRATFAVDFATAALEESFNDGLANAWPGDEVFTEEVSFDSKFGAVNVSPSHTVTSQADVDALVAHVESIFGD